MRVLVVEDDILIACDLVDILEELGAQVVGPAHSLSAGLDLIADQRLDFAFLDVRLGTDRSLPIAQALRDRQTPFAFLTGYAQEHLPDFPNTRYIAKPASRSAIEEVLKGLGRQVI